MRILSTQEPVIALGIRHESEDLPSLVQKVTQLVVSRIPESSPLTLFGMGEIGAALRDALQAERPLRGHYFKYHETYDAFRRPPEDLLRSDSSECCIVCSPPSDYYSLAPFLRRSEATFIFPFEDSFLEESPPETPPILLHLFPFAGTGRFLPVIKDLLRKLHHVHVRTDELPLSNRNYAASFANSQEVFDKREEIRARSRAILEKRVTNLYPGEAYYYHSPPIHPKEFPTTDYNTIYLIRDPRDVFVSCLHRHVLAPSDFPARDDGFEGLSKENALLRLIRKGIHRKHTSYCTCFPNLADTLDAFRHALHCRGPKFSVVRFEDLHEIPQATYRELLGGLGLLASSKTGETLSEKGLEESITLSSFRSRTNGRIQRGEQDKEFVAGCRKGIPGDWANHFTPRLKDAFKSIANGALIELGYEKNDAW